ncbi:hypothetical protein IFR05_010754 [Cadophora sp. M221]|nr:hypothetical protein IFR05_010754 [Cadophora sp. M221]
MAEIMQVPDSSVQEVTPGVGESTPGNTLEYHKLPTDRHIRLLDLKPSPLQTLLDQPMKIITAIDIYDLDNAPPFNALSYTWGDAYRDPLTPAIPETPPKFELRMTCNGKPVAITRNLYDALSAFVDARITGLIWVDAVCINQMDHVEKGIQVALMGDIYSRATEVLIWLGPHRDGIEDFLWATTNLLPTVTSANDRRQVSAIFWHRSPFDTEFWLQMDMESPVARLTKFALFYASCRWFSRAWILQEIVLARKSRMLCGKTTISVRSALDIALALDSSNCNWNSEVGTSIWKSHKLSSFFWLTELQAISLVSDKFQEALSQNRGRWKEDSSSVRAIAGLLSDFRSSSCFDARDKIYCLLGIVNGQPHQRSIFDFIKPDYTISSSEVFTKMTKLVLESSRSLDYMSDIRLRSNDNDPEPRLPSWVIDYTTSLGVSSLSSPGALKPKYDASLCEETAYPPFSVTDSQITCYGSKFDIVTEIMTSDMMDLNLATKESLLSFWQFFLSMPPIANGVSRIEALWFVLTEGLTYGSEEARRRMWEEHFKPWLLINLVWLMALPWEQDEPLIHDLRIVVRGILSTQSVEEKEVYDRATRMLSDDADDESQESTSWKWGALAFVHEVGPATRMRRLFKTDRGLLVMGTRTVQKDDQVWMLCDAHAPFVLRPTAQVSEFEVIGDCYVHGFMHGEMLEDHYGVKERIDTLKIV